MDAKEKSLSFLGENIRYIIPYFQRSYVWDEDNWKELWDELSSNKEDCFLGSIILKLENDSNTGETQKTVIDGQQRLTTLSILVEVLCEKFEESSDQNKVNIAKQYRQFLYYHNDVWNFDNGKDASETPKIRHSRLDKEYFENVITGKYSNMIDDINDESHKIYRCYKYFKQKINLTTDDKIASICRKLLNSTSNILVVINLLANENEQAIFDTINSAGEKLTAADIIKNALYQKINNSSINAEQHYKDNWFETFDKEDVREQWQEKKGSGVNQKAYIDIFFHCYAIMKGFFDTTQDRVKDLSKCYKRYVRGLSAQETKDFIEDICKNAKKYKEIFIGYDSVTGYKFNNNRNRLLHILNTIKVTIFDAFILYAVNTYTEGKCEQVFKYLETYVIRNYILGNRSIIQSYNQDLREMLSEKFNFPNELNRQELSNDRLRLKLKNIDNTPAKLALFWIELYLRATTPESDQNETGLTYNYQLEHIMPQSWEENWSIKDCPVYCKEEKIEDIETAVEIRKKSIYEIGNMTLLTAKLNVKISNSSFTDKLNGKDIDGNFEAGIKQNSSLRITVEDIAKESEWNESKITARTKKISDLFEKIWPIPQIN